VVVVEPAVVVAELQHSQVAGDIPAEPAESAVVVVADSAAVVVVEPAVVVAELQHSQVAGDIPAEPAESAVVVVADSAAVVVDEQGRSVLVNVKAPAALQVSLAQVRGQLLQTLAESAAVAESDEAVDESEVVVAVAGSDA
ncbi:MAG: hypothetical protein QXT13_10570, partial [Pyrobaculum sp.]